MMMIINAIQRLAVKSQQAPVNNAAVTTLISHILYGDEAHYRHIYPKHSLLHFTSVSNTLPTFHPSVARVVLPPPVDYTLDSP